MDSKVEQPNHYTVFITLSGNTDLQELSQIFAHMKETIFSVATEPVYLIFDVTQIDNFSLYIRDTQNASQAILQNPKVEAIYMIGIPNSLINFIVTETISPYQIPAYNVANLEEAQEAIEVSRRAK